MSPSFCVFLHFLPSGEAASNAAQVQPGEPVSVLAGCPARRGEARAPAGRTDPLPHRAVAGARCHLREEHDAAAPAGRHLPGDGHGAGRAPGGQQGLRLAQTTPESGSSGQEMEAPQVQELRSCTRVEAGHHTA